MLYWCKIQSNIILFVNNSIYEHIELVYIVCHESFCHLKEIVTYGFNHKTRVLFT